MSYRETSTWTSSPTFFVLRVGVLIAAIRSPTRGRLRFPVVRPRFRSLASASFFVYWIHVEMVCGFLTWPIHRRLAFERALVAFALFTVFTSTGWSR